MLFSLFWAFRPHQGALQPVVVLRESEFDTRRVEVPARPQSPGERPALHRRVEALAGAMHPRAPARETGRSIRHGPAVARDDPQKVGSGSALSTTQAGS